MKTNLWHKTLLWLSLGLLILLNGCTLFFAADSLTAAAGALLLLLFLAAVLRLLPEKSRLSVILWPLILLLQVCFILRMHNNIRYDSLWILEQAVEMLDTHRISPTLAAGYFSQVPNNYGLTILTYWFLSLVKLLGVPAAGYMRAVQFFNLLFFDLSLLFVWLTVRQIRGERSGTFFLFLCLISPYTYVWTPYYYTSTTSMAFAFAAVFLWLRARQSTDNRVRLGMAALLGFLCVTGFKIRATSLIAYIAIFLYMTMTGSRFSLRKSLRPLLIFLLTVCLSLFAWKGIVAHYAPFDTTDTALPVTHFMMMGARRDGGFNQDDLRYTISLPTAQAKREGTTAVIRARLEENGLMGNIQLLLNKQRNCWEDGTDSYPYELALCTDYHRLHTYIVGSKADILKTYSQAFRVLQLLMVCVSCLFALRRRRADDFFLLSLNLLGGMCFHLLWETAPLYSVAFTFFSYALMADGIRRLTETRLFERRQVSLSLAGISLLFAAATLGIAVSQWSRCTEETHIADDFVANQHMSTAGVPGPAMETGGLWRQSFHAAVPFNVLQLYLWNPCPETNASVYEITLSDSTGAPLASQELLGSSTGYDLYQEMQFEPIVPAGDTLYFIDIRPRVQDSQNYLQFSSQSAERVDLYPYGSLSVNGRETGEDLCFRIIDRHEASLTTKKEYGLLAALLLFTELFCFFCFRKASGFIHQKGRPVS